MATERMARLAGECALVTGSTSGIGKHVATMFAREGAKVVVTGRNRSRGQAVVDEIIASGGEAHLLPADLTEEQACTDLVNDAVQRLGGLTILVNNAVAATGGGSPVGTLDTAKWEQVLRVNLTSVAWLVRASVPHMRRAGHGSIINVSSRQAERASPGFAAYAASKGGLNALTRSIAVDHAKDNIRCNALSVGYVLNDRRDANMTAEKQKRLEGMHLTRLGQPEDIAYACVYLGSRESEFVTGALLPIDGGGTIARGLVLG